MRVVFFGTSEFAVPSLEALVAHKQALLLCVTQPDRPQGRGLRPAPSPVKTVALRLGAPLQQPEQLHRGLFEAWRPDVGVVIAYGRLIRQDLLEWPAHGMLGVHPSLLPRYRGAAPVAWALLNGETTTGVTIFRLNERLDAGDMLLQRPVTVQPEEDAEQLTRRLALLGAQTLVEGIEALATGRAAWSAQDESRASLAPKLTKAQGRVDWQKPAQTIERLVRALVPWPGAMCAWQGRELKLWKVSVSEALKNPSGMVPGTVMRVDDQSVTVATGHGALTLHEVQPAGRRRMPIKEFLAGHPVHVGDRLQTSDFRHQT